MTFNGDSGFRRFCGDPSVRLSIMYNFPEFDLMKAAAIYDTDSRYYNAFTGLIVSAVILDLMTMD